MIASIMAVAAALAGPAAPPACASLRAAVPAGWNCADTRHGMVIAGSAARAAQLAALATLGEQRFRRRFGLATPSYAVVEMRGMTADPSLMAELKRVGVRWRLPWLSEAAMIEAYSASITRGVTAKAQTMRLDAAQTATLVRAALAQQAARLSPESLRAREAGSLPHELGHGWFIQAYWAAAAVDGGGHYGGPAPDWMDETAAVLMEDDALADSRRRQFAAIYAGADAAARARLTDLTSFLSGGHPALPQLGQSAQTSGVRVLSGDEAGAIAAAAGTFYLQARLFADYVLERSGDPAAFRTAAAAFAAGKDTPEWLATVGKRLKLPTTVVALQADWDAWLRSRSGVPGGAS